MGRTVFLMKVLLSGSSGFIGSHLATALVKNDNFLLSILTRNMLLTGNNIIADSGWLDECTLKSESLSGCDVVVHTAGLAHLSSNSRVSQLDEFRRVNTIGTINFANAAASAGVRRFIYISSISIFGHNRNNPLSEGDSVNPVTGDAISKWDAENGLWEIQRTTGMEVVIIRPPLVYGPNAPGNFGSLVRFVEKGIPLPLGATHNQRSLVAVDNLVDLIITCIDHPAAANELFLAADGQDLSTTELLIYLAEAMDKPSRLIPLPSSLLIFGARLLGRELFAQKLLGSLQVDISKSRDLLGWEPPISVKEGLRRCFVSQEFQHIGC